MISKKEQLWGELIVEYNDGTFTATYKMTETLPFTGNSYVMTETRLYVGNDPYPTNPAGKETIAPGQFGNSDNYGDVTEYTMKKITYQVISILSLMQWLMDLIRMTIKNSTRDSKATLNPFFYSVVKNSFLITLFIV